MIIYADVPEDEDTEAMVIRTVYQVKKGCGRQVAAAEYLKELSPQNYYIEGNC